MVCMTHRWREADSNLQFRVDGAVETGADLNVRAGGPAVAGIKVADLNHPRRSGTDGSQTRYWRETDSNFQFRSTVKHRLVR